MKMEITNDESRETRRSSVEEQKTLLEEDGPVTSILLSSEAEVGLMIKFKAGASAYRKESKLLVLLQVNSTSVYNKAL